MGEIMEKIMKQDVFRKALEDAIKGKSANQAPFSKAWASGKLQKKHSTPQKIITFSRSAVEPQCRWNVLQKCKRKLQK